MELSKFTVNCPKSAQFTNPCPELHDIRTFRAHFSRFCIHSGKIAKIRTIRVMFKFISDFAQFTQAPANSAKSTLYLLICNHFTILTLVRQDPAPCPSESHEFQNLKLQFAKYQLCMTFQLFYTH